MSMQKDINAAAEHLKAVGEHLKDAGAKAGDKLKHTVEEQLHRGAAEAEREKRDLIGRELPAEEKIKSVVNEAKHTAQAGVDAFKKKIDDVK
jgi:hypothetical protein